MKIRGYGYIYEKLFAYRLHDSNVFGGRSLAQNLNKWKNKKGNSYKDYLEYRENEVIKKAYLDGAEMCLDYAEFNNNTKDEWFIIELITYYQKLLKSKYINFNIFSYFKFLGGKNLLKKEIKELIIFHFPIIGYLKYKIG